MQFQIDFGPIVLKLCSDHHIFAHTNLMDCSHSFLSSSSSFAFFSTVWRLEVERPFMFWVSRTWSFFQLLQILASGWGFAYIFGPPFMAATGFFFPFSLLWRFHWYYVSKIVLAIKKKLWRNLVWWPNIFWDLLEQFIQTIKVQINFWNRILFCCSFLSYGSKIFSLVSCLFSGIWVAV